MELAKKDIKILTLNMLNKLKMVEEVNEHDEGKNVKY